VRSERVLVIWYPGAKRTTHAYSEGLRV
jgi:hypothetical protein